MKSREVPHDTSAASYGSTSVPRRASARRTRCSTRATGEPARGTDVVVAFVETHGRARTAERSASSRSSRAEVTYRGDEFTEMDLGRACPAPQVALVDELAHTNVPGSSTPSAGRTSSSCSRPASDVISTVNIQHLESLNDVVQAITGVPQRETVPDSVVRAAEQVELVDMTPEALRRRMAHGNVYSPTRSTRRCPTTSGPATSPRYANSRCCGSPTASRRACSTTASNTESPRPGRRASASWSP